MEYRREIGAEYMFDPKTISELNKAFESSPHGFVVVDQGQPRFVVMDYERYQKLVKLESPNEFGRGKILVTGGAGYIGSVTVRVLQKKGHEVIVVDNLSTGRKERVKDCELVVADLEDRQALRKIFAKNRIRAVIHFAGSIEAEESGSNPEKYFANNVTNGINLLDVMVEFGVGKLVFSSSAAVYGDADKIPISEDALCRPTNPYGESKLVFEKMLKWYSEAHKLHSLSLRYFNAAGAWPEEGLGYDHVQDLPHLIPKVLNVAFGAAQELVVNGKDYATSDGTCVRDFIHVLDLADAHLAALENLEDANGAYAYNVGTGTGHSVLEIIDLAVEATSRMIPMRFGPRRAGDPARLIADSTKIFKDLGWKAQKDLRAIMQSAWQWQSIVKKIEPHG